MIDNIFMHYIDMPTNIKGTSTLNDDGSYSIFINSRLSNQAQSDAYMHELKHIIRLDFETKDRNVERVELLAHYE